MADPREWNVLLLGPLFISDKTIRRRLGNDYNIHVADSSARAIQLIGKVEPDVVLSEQTLLDGRGVDFLQQLRVMHPNIIRILVLAQTRREEIIKAINEAAVYQVVVAPLEPEQTSLMLKRALETRELARIHRYLSRELKFADAVLHRENEKMTGLLRETYEFDKLVFCSSAMAEVCNLAKKAAVTDLPVLIQGETGTGKELLARAIHLFSGRHKQIFLAQNCGALADSLLQSELFGHKRGAFTNAVSDRLGLFVAADGGTVFLDEISEISPAMQVSLLRFLQEGEVKPVGSDQSRRTNVRIIAAANRPLLQLVEEGSFRRDLYYRLRGFELLMPPLRDRPEDIPVLADFLVKKYAEKTGRRIPGITVEAMHKLKAYAFPGNVRELENEARRMVAVVEDGEFITAKHLSPEIAKSRPRPGGPLGVGANLNGATLKERVEHLEVLLIREALERHNWNHSRASRELGLSRVGLANKIKRYNLNRIDFQENSRG
ncbi:MAG: sigma-54 dependent transcriptional regulator [Pseudomonadota bacterium]